MEYTTGQRYVCKLCSLLCHVLCLLHGLSVWQHNNRPALCLYSAVCHAMSCNWCMAYQCGSTTTGQPCVCIQCGVPCHVLCLVHGLSVWQHNNRPALCLYTVRCGMPCPVSAVWHYSVATLLSVYHCSKMALL